MRSSRIASRTAAFAAALALALLAVWAAAPTSAGMPRHLASTAIEYGL